MVLKVQLVHGLKEIRAKCNSIIPRLSLVSDITHDGCTCLDCPQNFLFLFCALPPLCPPFFMPSHSSCPPIRHALPFLLPSHSSCPPAHPLLLPSHSSYPHTPPALPFILPSLSSCPPTLPTFPLFLPPFFFWSFVPSLSGRAWEGKGSRRAGGLGGQEEWEGRRAGLVQTPRRPCLVLKSVALRCHYSCSTLILLLHSTVIYSKGF